MVCPLYEYDGTVMFPFKVAVSENIYKEELGSGSNLRVNIEWIRNYTTNKCLGLSC